VGFSYRIAGQDGPGETRWAIGRMGDMPDSGLRVPKTCRAHALLCAPGSIADSKLWWCLLSC
jgi:hypothetical protein